MAELRAIGIGGLHSVGEARRAGVEAARTLGFDGRAVEEIAIVVTELATNLALHATRGGTIRFQSLHTPTQTGLEVLSEDTGPGIPNVALALTDGFTTAGSRGQGLGAVRRLADEFHIDSRTANAYGVAAASTLNHPGTVITVRKWLSRGVETESPFDYSALSRPIHSEQVNGDGIFLREANGQLVVAVFDGLGHGPHANAAATTALTFLESNFRRPFENVVPELHACLKATRGGVLGLARIDRAARTLSYCGVGNVEARVLRAPVPIRPISHNGTLGANLSRVDVQQFRFFPGALLVLTSDGISNKWDPSDYAGLVDRHPSIVAATVFRDFARANDDATIVVVRWKEER